MSDNNNFGWSADQFSDLKTQIQKGYTATFQADVEPFLKPSALYVMNLAKKWLKKDRLDIDEKHLIQDALHDAVARFEQRMNDNTVNYGNLQDWLVGNAFSRFQGLFEKEQKEKARFLAIETAEFTVVSTDKEEDMMVFLIAQTLDKMPDNAKYYYRRTLKMLYWQGYEIREIAEEIKVGYDNLRQELSTKIRPLFKQELSLLATQFKIDVVKNRVSLQ